MVTVLVVLLHGATGSWDEIVMLGGSVLIGLALAFILKPKKAAHDEPDDADAQADAVAEAEPEEAGATAVAEGRPKT